MRRMLALLTIAAAPIVGGACTMTDAARTTVPAPAPATTAERVPCVGHLWADGTEHVTDPVIGDLTCDVRPPQVLDVLEHDLTPAECDDMGGRFVPVEHVGSPLDFDMCTGVDY